MNKSLIFHNRLKVLLLFSLCISGGQLFSLSTDLSTILLFAAGLVQVLLDSRAGA